jgi:hypothetical protein
MGFRHLPCSQSREGFQFGVFDRALSAAEIRTLAGKKAPE